MFKHILYQNQLDISHILHNFSDTFYLAGGTAIALILGHRKSLDFDLFSCKPLHNTKIIYSLQSHGYIIDRVLIDNKSEELTVIISGVKVTFLHYPFNIELSENFMGIGMPSINTLGAMKFYTLGRRGKWKDYVDIYEILKQGNTLQEISILSDKIFQGAYNEKLLREQLCYYKDIDFSEEVEYMGDHVSIETIQDFLIEQAKS